jgi:hypothetical protein
MTLQKIDVKKKGGNEKFHVDGKTLPFSLLNFWQWGMSDLVSNTMRGVLVEYIVACDLGIAYGVRNEWDPYDLETEDGVKIEVKSAAYLQSWPQEDYSKIIFGISANQMWNQETGKYIAEKKRRSDVYIFCLLKHKDPATLDPMDLSQWTFYILPTKVLDEKLPEAKSISLAGLEKLNPVKAIYGELKKAINKCLH